MKTQIWVVMKTNLFSEPSVLDIVYSESEAEELISHGKHMGETYAYDGPFEIEIPDIVTINNNSGPINIRM